MTFVPTTFEQIDSASELQASSAPSVFSIEGSESAFGLKLPCWESSLFQWLITEASGKHISIPGLLFEDKEPGNALRKLRDSLVGATLCLQPAELFTRPEPKIVIELREELLRQLENWPDLASTKGAFVICADHLLSSRVSRVKSENKQRYRLPNRLYPVVNDDRPADWAAFNSLVLDLTRHVSGGDMQPVWFNQQNDPSIPTILHELFKNTHDHARTWWDGSEPSFSVRGISCAYYAVEQFPHLTRAIGKEVLDPPSVYIRELLDVEQNKLKKLRTVQSSKIRGFLELSIFDSGPGLVGRAKGQDASKFSPKEQLDIVRECLRKGYSSTENETRGYGLSKVIDRLRQSKGFLRIRTNSVNGFRSFARFGDLGVSENAESGSAADRLMDWRNLYSPLQTNYRALRGTVVTLIVPLGDVDE